MQSDLMEILACPIDHAELTLAVDSSVGSDIIAGTLTCTHCGQTYPITDAIPDLLPPSLS